VGIALLLGLLALAVTSAIAAAPAGPRLAIEVSRPYPQLDGIETVGPAGESPQLLIGGGGEDAVHPNGDRPAWSPDGSQLAFTSSFGEYSPVIYLVGADGGRARLLSKTTPLSEPVFTPDGRSLAFSVLRVVKGEFHRPAARIARRGEDDYGVIVDWAVLSLDVDGKGSRLLTPWRRNQVITPTSFSPDGSALAAERLALKGGKAVEDAVAIGLEDGRTRVLAGAGQEPLYSPDGSRIAFVRTTRKAPEDSGLNPRPTSSTLFLMPAAGGPTKLVRIKGGLAWPSWDPSGQRLAFTRLGGGSFGLGSHPQEGNSVMQVNADGTCLSTLLSIARGSFLGSAWQPGPGREAGPISC
jgi:Tol biopolymer transport system component